MRRQAPRCRMPGFALLGLLLLGACQGGEAKDRAAFTQRVLESLRQEWKGGEARIAAQPLTLELRFADGKSATLSLDNLWRQCHGAPDDCAEPIAGFVHLVAQEQGITGFVAKPELVRATIKDQSWIDQAQGKSPDGTDRPLIQPFAGGTWIVYVFDLPNGMRVLTRGDLLTLGLDEKQVAALALANLDKALGPIPHQPLEEGSAIHVVHTGDSYEISRLLLHGRWRDLAGSVKGDLLVGAPTRDYVLFTGSGEDPREITRFRELVDKLAREESHGVTMPVLRWTPEGWVVAP